MNTNSSLQPYQHFNPRPPRGVRHFNPRHVADVVHDFNPRTPRGVRPRNAPFSSRRREISIHAPREGCDKIDCATCIGFSIFQSTHPARGATPAVHNDVVMNTFQSTHPARGATTVMEHALLGLKFQSTHPARGATGGRILRPPSGVISIHAPREGCDLVQNRLLTDISISIHAPREGCDSKLY